MTTTVTVTENNITVEMAAVGPQGSLPTLVGLPTGTQGNMGQALLLYQTDDGELRSAPLATPYDESWAKFLGVALWWVGFPNQVWGVGQTMVVSSTVAFWDMQGVGGTRLFFRDSNAQGDQETFGLQQVAGTVSFQARNYDGSSPTNRMVIRLSDGALTFGSPAGGLKAGPSYNFEGRLLQDGVNLLHSASEVDAGSSVDLEIDGSPRKEVSATGAVTINAPTSGDGHLFVAIPSATAAVTLSGFHTERGTDSGDADRVAYVTRTLGGRNIWVWL